MKKCAGCGEALDLSAFHKDRTKKDGHKSRCRSCTSGKRKEQYWSDPEASRRKFRDQYHRDPERWRSRSKDSVAKWRSENRETHRNSLRRWRKQNPEKHKAQSNVRRRREKEADVSPRVSAAWMKSIREMPCYYCGTNQGEFHVDHRNPLSRGGTNHWINLVNSCATCNLSKGSKTEEEFGKGIKR